ncbi:class I SAM-dependent methyltransferase [Levilactobacillus fujinensis]|uniref:Class I SAM-dependent methyltransferase n=1 Tax=Levilactobacillus fujinensis TaxID=2486024 RepID=A0ABW1TGK2_9LACO|nr:methyltransferase domain-containing protein [Levilactobacillus fujinensis]
MHNWKYFGIDAPLVLILYLLSAIFLFVQGYVLRPSSPILLEVIAAGIVFIEWGLFLHTTIRGKYRLFDQVTERLGLKATDQVLDLGCGRGALLTRLASRLEPAGQAVGLDLWHSRDQSHNAAAVTQRNVTALRLTDRVKLVTGDMVALPFQDAQFDVVTTSFALHNIHDVQQRQRALQEAMRVLKPGGQLVIIDTGHHAAEYRQALDTGHLDIREVHSLGVNGWWSGPWMSSYLVYGVKQ